jgi:aminoglycoside phosphotransferase (APT) family kinase protein
VIEVDGRFGILFERIVGPTLVQQFGAKPWTLVRALRAFTDLHLAMHALAIPELPSQREQLTRLIESASPVPTEVREATLKRLDQLPAGNALCHGDYHPDNVLLTRNGLITIDWGGATSGHPLADVARTALLLHVGELPSPRLNRWLLASPRALTRRAYVRRYLQRRPAGAEELAAWRLPIAVARLGEGIVEERGKLLRLIESACP